jgi:hypothetical protein
MVWCARLDDGALNILDSNCLSSHGDALERHAGSAAKLEIEVISKAVVINIFNLILLNVWWFPKIFLIDVIAIATLFNLNIMEAALVDVINFIGDGDQYFQISFGQWAQHAVFRAWA